MDCIFPCLESNVGSPEIWIFEGEVRNVFYDAARIMILLCRTDPGS